MTVPGTPGKAQQQGKEEPECEDGLCLDCLEKIKQKKREKEQFQKLREQREAAKRMQEEVEKLEEKQKALLEACTENRRKLDSENKKQLEEKICSGDVLPTPGGGFVLYNRKDGLTHQQKVALYREKLLSQISEREKEYKESAEQLKKQTTEEVCARDAKIAKEIKQEQEEAKKRMTEYDAGLTKQMQVKAMEEVRVSIEEEMRLKDYKPVVQEMPGIQLDSQEHQRQKMRQAETVLEENKKIMESKELSRQQSLMQAFREKEAEIKQLSTQMEDTLSEEKKHTQKMRTSMQQYFHKELSDKMSRPPYSPESKKQMWESEKEEQQAILQSTSLPVVFCGDANGRYHDVCPEADDQEDRVCHCKQCQKTLPKDLVKCETDFSRKRTDIVSLPM